MTIEEKAEKAVFLKTHGYNCAQAVALALKDDTGLSEEELSSITSGFGAGMGTMEATCGALVGATIVEGLNKKEKGTMLYARLTLLDFKVRSGAVTCKDLKGVETGKTLCSCEDCVRNAVLSYGNIMGQP